MRDKVLHNETGMAIKYRDGWGVYALNGVRMDPWMVEDAPESMEAKRVLGVENVEQRRELIRRIGVERIVQSTGAKALDRSGHYELLSVSLGPELPDCRFLKMLNPSIGVWHVEGVHPSCQTVQHAINWRAHGDVQKEWSPAQLT